MSANVVFINIDWKSSRMNRTLATNMKILAKTIAGVVHNMKPTMICMSEVGETKHPLSEKQMQQLVNRSMSAWQNAATEHIQLRSMFTTGSPYMTIYIDGPIQCSNHRILHNLYYADGERRDAQTFVCSFLDHESADFVNVHAPSGGKRLKDSQRRTLLTNLLQSKSRSRPGSTIGHAPFLIGGDMNTSPHLLSLLLQDCHRGGSLGNQEQIHTPVVPYHGDLCFAAGIQASALTTDAPNHDPQHKPYGICWYGPQQSATEQSLPAAGKRATGSQKGSSASSIWNDRRAAPVLGSAAYTQRGLQPASSSHAASSSQPASSSGYVTEPAMTASAAAQPLRNTQTMSSLSTKPAFRCGVCKQVWNVGSMMPHNGIHCGKELEDLTDIPHPASCRRAPANQVPLAAATDPSIFTPANSSSGLSGVAEHVPVVVPAQMSAAPAAPAVAAASATSTLPTASAASDDATEHVASTTQQTTLL